MPRADDWEVRLAAAAVVALAAFAGIAALALRAHAQAAADGGQPPPSPGTTSSADDLEGSEEKPGSGDDLREAALSLLPPFAGEGPRSEELEEKTCYEALDVPPPCISYFYGIDSSQSAVERRRIAVRSAEAAGWRFLGDRDGFLFFERADLEGRVSVGPEAPPGCGAACAAALPGDVQVADFSRVEAIEPDEAPSEWSAERRDFVEAAEAICARSVERLEVLPHGRREALLGVVSVWSETAEALGRLAPPSDDERTIARYLRELGIATRAGRILARAAGEEALPAAVVAMERATRARRIARSYGLATCATLLG